MNNKLIIAKYESDGRGGVYLHCRREDMHPRVPNFPVHFGKWGVHRSRSSHLMVTKDELKWLRDKAIAYTSGTA